MDDISKIDKNFAVKAVDPTRETVFSDCLEQPFKVYGLMLPKDGDDVFRRIPLEVAQSVSDGVVPLSHHTAGGRIRFKTNSPYICIKTETPAFMHMPHFTLCGSAGFDLYKKQDGIDCFVGTFVPPKDMKTGYESSLNTGASEETEFTIHFPLYSRMKKVEIGLKAGSTLKAAGEYKFPIPVVYYGSSVTQGGCASRPGMAYQNIISREIGCDHINLGFSGSAKGEDAMAEYIATLDMSVFVMDYDYNAPTVEHLQNTHERFFKIIRQKQPDLPIVMVSRPKWPLSGEEIERRDIIKATHDNAKAQGDRNVYFIDGSSMMKFTGGNEGTVDNCHPTDLGFRAMASAIGVAVGIILQKNSMK